MDIYFDNSATTQVSPRVREAMLPVLENMYGNPSSLHKIGADAEQLLKQARSRIANCLRVDDGEIYFTSGGTEANNWALIGTAEAKKRRGRHIILSSVEHPSVAATADYLEQQGWRVTRLAVNPEGLVEPETLQAALCPDTVLVSVMLVNNEVGSRMPVEALGSLIKAYNPEIIFHVDAVQGFGKLRIYPKKWNIDLLTCSSHKIHGPKGCGCLYVDSRVHILPLIRGGEQQKGLRSGTENMPGIVGFGCAAQETHQGLEEKMSRLYGLKEALQQGLEAIEGVSINGPRDRERSAPHICSATFQGVRSEVLLHALEDRDIYVSAGSACSSHHRGVSPTLAAIGLSKEAAGSTLRFSLSEYSTEEEVETVIRTVAELLPVLRRFTRK